MNFENTVSDLLHGNPFATPVGALIEESTEDFVGAELWQLFSGVCQAINKSRTGPKDAIRALKRRFTDSFQSNETVAFNSLLLLETCMLNCGYRFHVAFATRSNLKDFAKLATDNLVPDRLRRKLLFLFQSWAQTSGNHVDLCEFSNVYTELKSQGVQFPASAQLSDGQSSTVSTTGSEQRPVTTVLTAPTPVAVQSSPIHAQPRETRTTKLSSDLAQVRQNICVLSDLVSDAESSQASANPEAMLLMADVAESLKQMSRRLSEAISAWEAYQETLPERRGKDSVLLTMLDVNDELHAVLSRYAKMLQTSNPESTCLKSDDMAATHLPQPSGNIDSFVGEPSPLPENAAPPVSNENGCDSVVLQPISDPSKSNAEDDNLIAL